jgi:chromosome segregation ATPase
MDELQYDEIVAKKLSYQERKKLAKSAFALVQKKDGKEIRRFPIHDCAHARNALSRLPQAKDLSDSERATVKRKAEAAVKRLCPKPKSPRTKGGTNMDKTMEQLQEELEEMTRKYDEQVVVREGVEAKLAEAQEQVETLTASVEELTGQLATANQEKAQVVTAHRREVLVMRGMKEEDIEGKEEDIGAMTDAQFELLIANVRPAQEPPPGVSGGFSPGDDGGDGGDGGDDKVLTL